MQIITRSSPGSVAPVAVPAPRVKGVNLRGLISSIRRNLGPQILESVLEILPNEVSRTIRADAYYSTGWYPLIEFRAIHVAVQRVTKRGPELARELSRDSTLNDFRGIYRVLLSVLSPEFLFKRSPAMFNRYFDSGKFEVTRADHGVADARFSGCTSFDRTLWEDTLGGCIGLLEACGAKNVEITVHSGGGDGDDHMSGTATWR